MWKKEEEQATTTGVAATTPQAPRSSGSEGVRGAVIGPSISIKGDVTGSEDLLIRGEVDGSVSLGDHAVGVGAEGRVIADIVGRVITVEGQVEGNLEAREQIVLRGTAKVRGDIKAPRVVLEDGATFRGLVDMGTPDVKKESDTSGSKKANGVSEGSARKDEAAPEGAVAKASSAVDTSGATSKKSGDDDSSKGSSARASSAK
ncbi:MAG: polymer-forming cytoskeletal protein [Gemmatimonadetes bacterium]|nr:polymer-forming cytoskeletal protein [Gemmatimonadota bacterium]NNF14597.1 polymer-forming cytoskeletal protein [Gemmatimonadota bacterium]